MRHILNFTLVFALFASSATASPTAGVPALSVTAPNGQSSILIGSAHVSVEGLLEPDASVLRVGR